MRLTPGQERIFNSEEFVDSFARDEMNLAEFPLTLLTDRAPAGQTMLEREVQIREDRTGKTITRRVTITASDVYGLPTAQDNIIILGLIYLSKRANDFQERRVWFTRSELIRILNWPDTGSYYKRITDSLCRWANVFVLYENAWWEKSRQAYVTKGFGIIDDFEINETLRDGKQLSLFKSNFAWNDVFFQSLESGFVRGIDLRTLLKLKHPAAQQMYRFLGKHFYRSDCVSMDLKTFACEHVGLGRNYTDNGKLKEKLQPALSELEAIGFLRPMSKEERYKKVGRSEWRITLVRNTSTETVEEPTLEEAELEEPILSEQESALIARGVTKSTASELLNSISSDQLIEKIEAFDWLMSKKDKRVSKNPSGYLVDSIRKGYVAPKGFESQAAREKRVASETEKRQRAEAAKRQAETEQKAKEQAERARIDSYWNSLTSSEQEKLKEEALSKANTFLIGRYRANFNVPAAAENYLKVILDQFILKQLDGSNTPTESKRED